MTTDTHYYASTAYDSNNPRELEPLHQNKQGYIERVLRKKPLFSRGCQCREFLVAPLSLSSVEDLHDYEAEEVEIILKQNRHQSFCWATFKNKLEIVESIVFVAMWFWVFGGLMGVGFIGITLGFDEAWLYAMLTFFVFPFSIWWLGRLAIRRGWVKDDNNVHFNRRTGLITLPWEKTTLHIPFDEFEPYLADHTSANGISSEFLRLVHRYSNKFVACPVAFYHHYHTQMAWEFIQRFMDTAHPLPDIPTFDFARQHDPVSLAYDKKHNRPKNYWKNIDLQEADKMEKAAFKALKQFPWGKTREQAIESGWIPSGVGEGAWRQPKEDKKDKKDDDAA